MQKLFDEDFINSANIERVESALSLTARLSVCETQSLSLSLHSHISSSALFAAYLSTW